MRGSEGFVALIWSLSLIISPASVGIELMVLGILPAGMFALAALVITSLRNFSLTCGLSVVGELSRESSI